MRLLSLRLACSIAVFFACLNAAWGEAGAAISSATLGFSVRDAILRALENNRSLAVERYGPEIMKTFVAEEQSVFDPALASNLSAAESKGQRTSGVGAFTGVSSRQRNASINVAKRTPLGVNLDLSASATERSSNVYTKLFSTRLGASLTLPLLRGLGSNANLAGVRLAESDVDISQYELIGFVLALAAQVEKNYWDLLAAREELKIRLASLDLAWQQLAETKDRIEVGQTAEIELAAAEGETALREEAVIDARSLLQTTALQFLSSLNLSLGQFSSVDIALLDAPSQEETPLASETEDIAQALENRPDIGQARVQRKKQKLEIVRTRNGLLPQLDFFITLGQTGYAASFDQSILNLDQENYDITGGMIFQYDLGNRAAKARNRRVQFREKEAQAAIANFEQLIELDVRLAHIEVERSTQQIVATHAATRLQQGKYQAEMEKFRVGKSTNLLVLVAQRDLIQSQLDEMRSQIAKRLANMKLEQAKGTLLDRHMIVMPTDPTP
ncbi:MAG: TolC family protein [Candidatus Omnitrophota bacterium]